MYLRKKNLSCVDYLSVFLQPKAPRAVADAAKLINKTDNPDRPTFLFGLPRTTDPKPHSVYYFPALKTVAVKSETMMLLLLVVVVVLLLLL